MTESCVRPFFFRGLPESLRGLETLALDLRWTWSHAGDSLWRRIDERLWEQTGNAFVVLQNITAERLAELQEDESFRAALAELLAAREKYNSRPGWYGERYGEEGPRSIAYFSMEFGLSEALPIYAGGLGVLAGDYLKAASDLGAPVFGIGLLYQEGYFRQWLDDDGWQREIYSYNDSSSLPLRPARAPAGPAARAASCRPGRVVQLRVWLAQVGRVPLYLLDSNVPVNAPHDQGITRKLYGGGQEMRLIQEMVLGIGGWRVIEALRLPVEVCHLNEGHAAFVTLERARAFMVAHDVDFFTALWATRAGNVFTTHTPVAAGFDRYDRQLLARYGREFAHQLDVEPEALLALGRADPDDDSEPFNMAWLAARTCLRMNGVSRLHGEVSRWIFRDLYPRWPLAEVPVCHVTNGVHVPSWDSPWADALWTEVCGKERWMHGGEMLGENVAGISDEDLWALRGHERADLVQRVRERLARQLAWHGVAEPQAEAARRLDPNCLTLGFARRFTEYKRPHLLLTDPDRLARLLNDPQRPVQIVVAGKAHPADRPGKQLVQAWARFVQRPDVRAHAVFLEDYDLGMAQELVQGVDVWLNTPRRPWEASGTSGMKVLVNGGLNLSELDGWWAEAWRPEVGWALGDGREHDHDPAWDAREAEQLYRLLEEEIVPAFYDRDGSGIPRRWIAMVRTSMAELAPRFSTNRMVREYIDKLYAPAARALRRRQADGCALARDLHRWAQRLRRHWSHVHLGRMEAHREDDGWHFAVPVYLGEITPGEVAVELYADPAGDEPAMVVAMHQEEAIAGAVNGYVYRAVLSTTRPVVDFTPRILPAHPEARVPAELPLIRWPA